VKTENLENKFREALEKQVEAISLPSGIIFEKHDTPSIYQNLGD